MKKTIIIICLLAIIIVSGAFVVMNLLSSPSGSYPAQVGSVPLAPSNLVATPISSNQINLTWQDNSTDEDNFTVHRSVNNFSWVLIATVASNTTSYSDSGLATGTTYWYRVLAKNSLGSSPSSNVATATTTGTSTSNKVAPATPSNLSASASTTAGVITVSWTDNSANETTFTLQQSDSASFTTVKVIPLAMNVTTYSDSGLGTGVIKYYRVLATNAYGASSPWSNTASSSTLTLPAKPTNLIIQSTTPTSFTLVWQDNSNNESSFTVQRDGDSSFGGSTSYTLPASTTTYVNAVQDGTLIKYFRVRSKNDAGNSDWSNVVSGVYGSGTNPPATTTPPASTTVQWVTFDSTTLSRATTAGCTIIRQVTEIGMTALNCDPTVAASLGLEQDLQLSQADSVLDAKVGASAISVAPMNITGSGRQIVLLDYGYDSTLKELAGNFLVGKSFTDPPLKDCDWGHGSSVASVIIGQGITYPQLKGVAPQAKIVAGKIAGLDKTGTNCVVDMSTVIDAMLWGINNYSPDVINISEATGDVYNTFCDNPVSNWLTSYLNTVYKATYTVNKAWSKNILVVAGAGDATRTPTKTAGGGVSFPACLKNVISVGAVDNSDVRETWSNYGNTLDLTAPNRGYVALPGDTYAIRGGTSYAAPLVSGTISLIKQAHPTWTADNVTEALFKTARQPATTWTASADRYGCSWNSQYGCGIVDACRAVNYDPATHTIEPTLSNYFGQNNNVNAASVVGKYAGCLVSLPQTQVQTQPADPTKRWVSDTSTYTYNDGSIYTKFSSARAEIPALGNSNQPIDFSITVVIPTGTTKQLNFNWALSTSHMEFTNNVPTCCQVISTPLSFLIDGALKSQLTSNTFMTSKLLTPASYSLTAGRHTLTWRLQGTGNGVTGTDGFVNGVTIQ